MEKHPKLFALLVGINTYPEKRSLRGCHNDVWAVNDYLSGRFKKVNQQIICLIDQQATKAAIIQVFREEFIKATPNDFILFYFSGHGSTEPVPVEFKPFNPSGQIETLVCYDSYRNGSWGLSDKELAALIYEVGKNNPQIIIITDCCHAGSMTRLGDDDSHYERTRTISGPEKVRPAYQFYGYSGSTYKPFISNHILLAACRNDERSVERLFYFEDQDEKVYMGAFTHSLLSVLDESPLMNYAKLKDAVTRKLLRAGFLQSPQLQIMGNFNPFRRFLGHQVDKQLIFPIYFEHGSYFFDGGLLDFQHFSLDQIALGLDVGIYPIYTPAFTNNYQSAVTKTIYSDLKRSEIYFPAHLNFQEDYIVMLLSKPVDLFSILLEGSDENLKNCFKAHCEEKNLQLNFVEEKGVAEYSIRAEDHNLFFHNLVLNHLIQGVSGALDKVIDHTSGLVAQVSYWNWLRRFQKPDWHFIDGFGNFNPQNLEFWIEFPEGHLEDVTTDSTVIYLHRNEHLEHKNWMKNRTGQKVFLTHLTLDSKYGVDPVSSQMWNNEKAEMRHAIFELEPEFEEEEVIFKVIVSDRPFSEIIEGRKSIPIERTVSANKGPNRGFAPRNAIYRCHWFTKEIRVVLKLKSS